MHTHILLGEELLMKLDYTLPATEGMNIVMYDTMYTVLDIMLDLNAHPHKMIVHVFDAKAQHDAEEEEAEMIEMTYGIPMEHRPYTAKGIHKTTLS